MFFCSASANLFPKGAKKLHRYAPYRSGRPLVLSRAKKAVLFSPRSFIANRGAAAPLWLGARSRGLAFASPPLRPSLARASFGHLRARASQALTRPCPSFPLSASPLLRLHCGGVAFGLRLAQIAVAVPFGSTPAFVRPNGSPQTKAFLPLTLQAGGFRRLRPSGRAAHWVALAPPAFFGCLARCGGRCPLPVPPRGKAPGSVNKRFYRLPVKSG